MNKQQTLEQTEDSPRADVAAQVLAMHFPDRVFSIPIFVGSGAVSTVYRADSDGEAFAVKLHAADRANISEYERGEYEREHQWTARAAAAGVPCSQVFAAGWHGNIAYSVQTFIVGVSGLDCLAGPLFVWNELGRMARLTNSIPVEDADAKWRSYVASILEGMTGDDVKITLGLYTAPQQAGLRRIFEKLAALPLCYGFSHCDLHPRNTIVTPEGEVVLLDWGHATRDINIVPHAGLASLLWEPDAEGAPFRAFLAGYGLSDSDFEALLPEVLALDLISCFWFFENPPRSEFGRELVAHAKQSVADHLPMLTEWAARTPA